MCNLFLQLFGYLFAVQVNTVQVILFACVCSDLLSSMPVSSYNISQITAVTSRGPIRRKIQVVAFVVVTTHKYKVTDAESPVSNVRLPSVIFDTFLSIAADTLLNGFVNAILRGLHFLDIDYFARSNVFQRFRDPCSIFQTWF